MTDSFGLSVQDQADTIRGICIGISAHQKLELLSNLVKLLGYESLAVFGDCFDEVCPHLPITVSKAADRLQGILAAFTVQAVLHSACKILRHKHSILAYIYMHIYSWLLLGLCNKTHLQLLAAKASIWSEV